MKGLKTGYKNKNSYLLVEKGSKEPFTTFNDFTKELEYDNTAFSKIIDNESKAMRNGKPATKTTRLNYLKSKNMYITNSKTEGPTFKIYNNKSTYFDKDTELTFYPDTKIPPHNLSRTFKNPVVPKNIYKSTTNTPTIKRFAH